MTTNMPYSHALTHSLTYSLKDVPISFIRKVIKDNILGLNSGVTEYEKYELYKRVSAQTPAGEFLTDKEIG
jgi:hypothetical protein